MNVFVPDGADEHSPILLRTYVGGYMASEATTPQASDASSRALAEGMVLAIPGSRGRNSTNSVGGQTIYTGRAPGGIVDLKAAIRYLRAFDKVMPGDAELIITDGTSAGGAMSALMGGTGNSADYEPYLKAMGAANERDDVYASIAFFPITELDHADMAYEWLYGGTTSRQALNGRAARMSSELASQFPAYINSLGLKQPDGTPLTADNYRDYIKSELIRSAQIAKNAGADIPDSIGFTFSSESMMRATLPPVNGGLPGATAGTPPRGGTRPMMGMSKRVG